MKNKIFLSSMLIMSVAPAMAEPSNTGEFPSGGLMQEDYTYTNAATSTNMDGVYEGSVNATAEYDTIDYILTAGQYLPADSETITPCPAGSFCSGGTTVQYNQNLAQGIETCPTGYASSALGSSSNTQCYRACDINNMGANGSIANIAHATAISGNDYYGSGADTCEPTNCENGYHVGGFDVVSKNAVVPIDYNDVPIDSVYRNADGSNNDSNNLLSDNNTWALEYSNNSIVYGRASCQPTVDQGIYDAWYYSFKVSEGEITPDNYITIIQNHFGSAKANLFESLYVKLLNEEITPTELVAKSLIMFGVVDGPQYTTTSTGKYCFCQVNGYELNTGQKYSVSGPWIRMYLGMSDAAVCASDCAANCVANLTNLSEPSGHRGALFGAFGTTPAICDANIININWSNADAEDISANNAGTATYGSDVRTPVKAQTIKGKTFKGWRFSKPEQTTTN